MHLSITTFPWRRYGVLALIVPVGFVFGLLCFLLVLITGVLKGFVFVVLALCGLGVVVSDRLRKIGRHA
jgi:hypothetical protein